MIYKSAYIKVEKKEVMGNTENISVTFEVTFDQGDDVTACTEQVIAHARAIIDEEKELPTKKAPFTPQTKKVEKKEETLDTLFD